jgi:concentrative nucleoside transporter, CNT family
MQVLWGIGGIAPSRRGHIVKFGIRAVVARTLAHLMSGAIVEMLI